MELAKTVVVDTTQSPHARLRPVSVNAVQLEDNFWKPRQELNQKITLMDQYRLCEETGRIDNLRRLSGKKKGPFQGLYFNDSDVYKWLEAAASTLSQIPDAQLTEVVELVSQVIEAAQSPDGYLNSYFALERAGERWTDLATMHELYVAGHFIQAAVAYYRATGSEKLLEVARRLANHIIEVFGPAEEGKKAETDGHPEIEMALVELFRVSRDPRYLKQAQFFLNVRLGLGRHNQAEQPLKPFRELERFAGHTVCALYLASGASDIYAETGEETLLQTLRRLWDNLTTRQIYISGGIGPRWLFSAFGRDYELPNERAFAETCAAVASVMWNHRMLLITGECRYADLLEHTLYNGVLPGVSLDGRTYFYQNPLADNGTHRRVPWFECACCPPNLARLLAQLPGYFYSTSPEGVYVHLYAAAKANITLDKGHTPRITTSTNYPWDGAIELEVEEAGESFSVFLRIPAWAEKAELQVGNEVYQGPLPPGSYVEVKRNWQEGGHKIRLNLPMPVRQVEAHPYVAEDRGKIALLRGPLLYCLEQADNPGLDLRSLAVPAGSQFTATYKPEPLKGVVVLEGKAVERAVEEWENLLYRPRRDNAPASREVKVTAIPYYAWANREPGRMQVWLNK